MLSLMLLTSFGCLWCFEGGAKRRSIRRVLLLLVLQQFTCGIPTTKKVKGEDDDDDHEHGKGMRNVQMGQGFKGDFKSSPIAFCTLFASIFPHQYVCLWHPLSVLAADSKVHAEATAVKWGFLTLMS